MTSGGPRARAGRTQDPEALRRGRDGGGEWTLLPRSGRDGPVPDWPLASPTDRELQVWAEQWKRPQALMWERNGQETEVALFVRSLVDAESHRATTAARTLARQMLDTLGLSVPGLRVNRWRIVDDTTSVSTSVETPVRARRASKNAKDRLRVIHGGDDR